MKIVLGITAVALLLSGCGDSSNNDDSEAKATPTEASTPTEVFEPEPTPTESEDPFAPNLGERALKVGETRDGLDIDTTLHEVRYPFPPAPAEYRTPESGKDFLGLRLETCLTDSPSTTDNLATYNGEWTAVTRDGVEYAGSGSYWDDWPTPKYPESKGMVPGRCMKGWMLIEVPKGIRFQSILFRPAGTPVAEWLP